MKRYEELKKKKDPNNGSVYRISLPSSFELNQQFYTTYSPSNYERLDNIAYKFYGDAKYWWVIAKANKAVNGKFFAREGQVLIIPEIEQ